MVHFREWKIMYLRRAIRYKKDADYSNDDDDEDSI